MSQTANLIAKLNAVVDSLLKIAIVVPSRCDEHRRGNKTGSLNDFSLYFDVWKTRLRVYH